MHTGNFFAKNSKFSRETNPPPLHILSICICQVACKPEKKQMLEVFESKTNFSRAYIQNTCLKNLVSLRDLKSVDGSLPCQPIIFHWSETSPCRSESGNAAYHNAFNVSCKWMKIMESAIWILQLDSSYKYMHIKAEWYKLTWWSRRALSNTASRRAWSLRSLSSCKSSLDLYWDSRHCRTKFGLYLR